MLRSTLLAAAALALAVPAHAATLELRAGPVTLAQGQVARTLVTNAGTSLCRCRVVFQRHDVRRGRLGRPRPAGERRTARCPAAPGWWASQDPNIMPAAVAELVQALAVIECRSLTAAQMPGNGSGFRSGSDPVCAHRLATPGHMPYMQQSMRSP